MNTLIITDCQECSQLKYCSGNSYEHCRPRCTLVFQTDIGYRRDNWREVKCENHKYPIPDWCPKLKKENEGDGKTGGGG